MAHCYTLNHVNAQLYQWAVHIDIFLNKLVFDPKGFFRHIILIISYIYNEEPQHSGQAGGLQESCPSSNHASFTSSAPLSPSPHSHHKDKIAAHTS